MLYQNTGDKFALEGKTFTVGGEVFANGRSDYWGLFGTVTEIRTGADKETENDAPDICCSFRPPESCSMACRVEERFSALYGQQKKLEELALDNVVMSPEMLEPLPQATESSGGIYSLSCHRPYGGDGCDYDTLAVSSDVGALMRKMLDHLEDCETKAVLADIEQVGSWHMFAYESEEAGNEELYICYTISETPVLPESTEAEVTGA